MMNRPDVPLRFRGAVGPFRAVETEQLAIDGHEAAARRLDQLAAEMEQQALRDRDEQRQERAMELAAIAHMRARPREKGQRRPRLAAKHPLLRWVCGSPTELFGHPCAPPHVLALGAEAALQRRPVPEDRLGRIA